MSKANSFRETLAEMIEEYGDKHAGKPLCPHDYLLLAADVCTELELICREIGGNDDEFNQLVSDCEWAVQTYIVPIDLTRFKVPVFVERFVIDPQLVPSVRPLLEAMRPKQHSEEPKPN